jgi:hypothetical protein
MNVGFIKGPSTGQGPRPEIIPAHLLTAEATSPVERASGTQTFRPQVRNQLAVAQ